MKEKIILIFSLTVVMILAAGTYAAEVTFHLTDPTPGPDDIYNLVGASRDANNVGTYDYDTWLNNETTYIADDRPAQGQTFVTGNSEPVYLLTGVWIRHCGYTDSTDSGTANNGTWYSMPAGSEFGIRITDPAASGTSNFVLGSETYTVTRNEENVLPAGATGTANGTGTWMHFVLDTPIIVGPDTTYGFDVVSMAGGSNMFFEMLGIKDDSPDPPGNPYTTGTAYTSGAGGAANNTLTEAPGDRVFLVELVGTLPQTASIPGPADKARGTSTDPVLSWNAGRESTGSKVYLGTRPGSLELLATITHTQDVERYEYTATGLDYNKLYYWRVDQVQQTGEDIIGDIWSFTTGTIKASDPSPYNDEIAVLTDIDLSWTRGLGSTESKLYFGTDPDALELQTTIAHMISMDQYSYAITGLINDQNYYWRVDETLQNGDEVTGDIWRFTTIPIIPVTNPNLVGWWKFDEGTGKAIDFSGLNQHGTVYGDPESVYGYDGNAMNFDGSDDYVNLPIGSTISSLNSTTITTWANVTSTAAWQRIFDFGVNPPPGPEAPTIYMYLTPVNGAGVMGFIITTDGGTTGAAVESSNALPSNWHHVAAVIDDTDMTVTLYVDGAAVANGPTQILPSDLGNTPDNYLGKSKRWENSSGVPDPHLTASLDDFRIYDYALTEEEINQVMQIDPLRANDPDPAHGQTLVIEDFTALSWQPGGNAAQHDVYLGTNEIDVAEADATNAGIYRGQQAGTSYTPPEGVEWGTRYYWRIDEVNNDGSVSTGSVWTFDIADYLIVEDFEDYNDYPPNEVWNVWIDGYFDAANGSTAGYPDPDFVVGEHYLETTIVHGGSQSFPLFYDNSVGLSEVTKSLTSMNNWTRYDVDTLTLWYYGIRSNAAESMYVALNDAIVVNSNQNAARVTEWIRWDIPLSEFADQGVNLTNVSSISIGFGNKANPIAGGSGHVFFDDIRLYRLDQ